MKIFITDNSMLFKLQQIQICIDKDTNNKFFTLALMPFQDILI